jgi:hypothetical protein
VANTFAVSRNHLIFGLCLPLGVLLGYMLAEPLDSGSLAVIVLVLSVLCVPLMMRWHHVLLLLTWNAAVSLNFLPGKPALWMIVALLSFFFGILGRSVSEEKRFMRVPALTRSLLCLLGVVLVTALTTGGVGIKALGGERYGGKGYFIIAAAVIGYFAFSSQAIPRQRANWLVALFFLSGLTAVMSNLAYLAGPKYYFLYEMFPADLAVDQASADAGIGSDLVRLTGLMWASQALYGFLLAHYGLRGLFDLARPWRPVFLLGSVGIILFAGFRSGVILFGLTFLILYWVEGLWKTKTSVLILVFLALVGAGMVSFVDRMPASVQRALSFLPIKIDPRIKQAAQDSTEWRLEIWKSVWPEVPRYLFHGKGYALNPQELFLVEDSSVRGYESSHAAAAFVGNYHSGPLSVVIPFGLYGVAAFAWFLGVAIRVLYRNHRYGDPALRQINACLLAFFVARAIFFVFIFGAFYSDLFYFTGLVGLSVALNRGEARATARPALATD